MLAFVELKRFAHNASYGMATGSLPSTGFIVLSEVNEAVRCRAEQWPFSWEQLSSDWFVVWGDYDDLCVLCDQYDLEHETLCCLE
jgi:hypothetical protein